MRPDDAAGFGPAGQERLAGARVLIIGAADWVVTATLSRHGGVSTIGLVDDDAVEASRISTGRSSTGNATSAGPRSTRPPTGSPRSTRTFGSCGTGESERATRGVGRDIRPGRGWADNFCDALCRRRRLRAEGRPHLGLSCGSICSPAPPPAGSVLSCAGSGCSSPCATIGAVCSTEAVKVLVPVGMGRPLVGRLLVHDALRADVWRTPSVPTRLRLRTGGDRARTGEGVLAAVRQRRSRRAAAGDGGPRRAGGGEGGHPDRCAGTAGVGDRHDRWGTRHTAWGVGRGRSPGRGPCVAYCAGGVRSQRALAVLDGRGSRRVIWWAVSPLGGRRRPGRGAVLNDIRAGQGVVGWPVMNAVMTDSTRA